MLGYMVLVNGPIHWVAKRQTYTARSLAEAEIYATDECVKQLKYISLILSDLWLKRSIMPHPTPIYNDNRACVLWSEAMTTKGLRHVQIRENGVREMVQNNEIKVLHIEGKINPADIFTKEDKCAEHYCAIRDTFLTELRAIRRATIKLNNHKNIMRTSSSYHSMGGVSTLPTVSTTSTVVSMISV